MLKIESCRTGIEMVQADRRDPGTGIYLASIDLDFIHFTFEYRATASRSQLELLQRFRDTDDLSMALARPAHWDKMARHMPLESFERCQTVHYGTDPLLASLRALELRDVVQLVIREQLYEAMRSLVVSGRQSAEFRAQWKTLQQLCEEIEGWTPTI